MQLLTIGEASICLPFQNKLNYNDMAYHITDHDIQALIDNELDAEEEKFVRELIKKNISGEVLPLPVDSEGLANSMESQLGRYRRDEEVMDIMKTVEDLTIEHYVDMLIAMLLETRRKKQ